MQRHYLLVLILFFVSGVTALAFEVFWLKELGMLFGNASYAMATTLAAFFAGLALGGYDWGRRVVYNRNPLRLYALLELGVAISALGYFLILEIYGWLYPWIFAGFSNDRVAFTAVKFMLSLLILLPPAYFMGGTLPVLSHYLTRRPDQLGRKTAILYTCNTLGAGLGVYLAGFYLPPVLGYINSYLLIMSLTGGVAISAFYASRGTSQEEPQTGANVTPDTRPAGDLILVAFVSGFALLALQVLWGRMFAQVLQNSVYTFSILLLVFLFCLSLGSALAYRLMHTRIAPQQIMVVLLTGGALLVTLTPFLFIQFTEDLRFIGANAGWQNYIIKTLLTALAIMGPPLLLLGCVFPLIIRLGEHTGIQAGRMVGQLTAINTCGGLCGSLFAGFIILDQWGLWSGIRLIAIIYLLTAWFWLDRLQNRRTGFAVSLAVILLVTVTVFDSGRLPRVRVDPLIDQESLLEVQEGSAGTVAVIRRGEHLKIKLNNHYTLGGTGSLAQERFQATLPLLLHPQPESVYFLGLGTGITAGAGLDFPIKTLVATEIVPEVITLADKYFGAYSNNLFFDRRVTIIAEDGRNYLRGTQAYFDVIISDLFVPWKAGTGNLYSREHFQAIEQRLNPDGLFMQWLPAYQLSSNEFRTILRTMSETFPQVTVWRGDFSALRPVIGLLGHKNRHPLSGRIASSGLKPDRDKEAPILAHYIGSLEGHDELFRDTAINTDDRPLIEFSAPVTQRRVKSGQLDWFAEEGLLTFMQQLQAQHTTFYLTELDARLLNLPQAGLHAHQANFFRQSGKLVQADEQIKMYYELLSKAVQPEQIEAGISN